MLWFLRQTWNPPSPAISHLSGPKPASYPVRPLDPSKNGRSGPSSTALARYVSWHALLLARAGGQAESRWEVGGEVSPLLVVDGLEPGDDLIEPGLDCHKDGPGDDKDPNGNNQDRD